MVMIAFVVVPTKVQKSYTYLCPRFVLSLGYQCPIMYNPTDYFIKVLAVTPGSEAASHQAIKSICDRFAVSDAAKELDMDIHLEYHLMDNEDEVRSKIIKVELLTPESEAIKSIYVIYAVSDVAIRGLETMQGHRSRASTIS